MSIIDRGKVPEFKVVEDISVPIVEVTKLANGVEVFFIKTLSDEISEFQFVFEGGVWQQEHLLEANVSVHLMSEGTEFTSSAKIAEIFDFYGAYFSSRAGMHASSFKLMCLNKYQSELLKVIVEIFKFPIFEDKEFNLYRNKKKEQLIVDLEEVDLIARNELEQSVFGPAHPYGWSAKPEDYDLLKRDWLIDYYKKNIRGENLKIFVTSDNKEKVLDLLNMYFGDLEINKNVISINKYKIISGEREKIIQRPDAVQSAVRLGWKLFDINHKDYLDFMMLNALLGGYFGSRLMQNIRQKKGYTYSIYSNLNVYKYDGSFEIISEVNKKNKMKVIDEIVTEVEKLRNEMPTNKELENMKNYLSGSILSSLDGVFSFSRSLVTFVIYNLGFDYYQNYFAALKAISPERINYLAKKYLNPDEMFKVIVG